MSTQDTHADPPSLTPDEFASLEKMSRAKLYELWAKGEGPRYFNVGNRRRISEEARVDWRRKLEEAANASAS